MSALEHYLEEEGIATVAIALIRPKAERTKPPRALWVPFELGRPLGPPSDAAFQRGVLLAALHMLVEGGGPVRIADFADDDRRARPGFSPPLILRFAVDDLKAYVLEAAAAGPAKPSSRQLGDWLWNETVLGAGLQVLRRTILAGDDERLKAAAAFFVPALRVPPGG